MFPEVAGLDELLREVENLDVEACTWRGRGYIKQKLRELRTHAKVLAGLGDDGGHSRQTHGSWCSTALSALRSTLPFGQAPRGLSAFEH